MNRVDKTANYIYSLQIIAPTHFVTRNQKFPLIKSDIRGKTFKVSFTKFFIQSKVAPRKNGAILSHMVDDDFCLLVTEVRVTHQFFERGMIDTQLSHSRIRLKGKPPRKSCRQSFDISQLGGVNKAS